jgi:hypothetical protein
VNEGNLKSLQKFLFEQDDMPPPPPMDDGSGSGGASLTTPPVFNTPTINLNDFARSVARLINNFEPLLDPKTVLLNRAEAYVAANYDAQTAKHFNEIMEQNYGLHPTKTAYPDSQGDPVIYGTTGPSSYTGGGGGGA